MIKQRKIDTLPKQQREILSALYSARVVPTGQPSFFNHMIDTILPQPSQYAANDFKIGDMVKVKTGNGRYVKNLQVIGFCHPQSKHHGTIYVNWDTYWAPLRVEDVKK